MREIGASSLRWDINDRIRVGASNEQISSIIKEYDNVVTRTRPTFPFEP